MFDGDSTLSNALPGHAFASGAYDEASRTSRALATLGPLPRVDAARVVELTPRLEGNRQEFEAVSPGSWSIVCYQAATRKTFSYSLSYSLDATLSLRVRGLDGPLNTGKGYEALIRRDPPSISVCSPRTNRRPTPLRCARRNRWWSPSGRHRPRLVAASGGPRRRRGSGVGEGRGAQPSGNGRAPIPGPTRVRVDRWLG